MTDREQIRRDDEHEHVFAEEQEPGGRLILGPCFVCGLPALEAIEQAKKENAEDALRWGKANQALILEREQATTRAAKAEWDLEAEKTRGIDHATYEAVVNDRDEQEQRALRAERERDEALWKVDNARLVVIPEYERQLAKVPALVEALRWVVALPVPRAVEAIEIADTALTAYEQEQKP